MTSEEKQKAIDALKISAPIMAVTQEEFTDYIQTLNKIMDWLEQEPKTGHWVEERINEWSRKVFCSECGFEDNRYMFFRYCPNCGCRMVDTQKNRCADCNHYGKLSLDCGRCDDDYSMYEPTDLNSIATAVVADLLQESEVSNENQKM